MTDKTQATIDDILSFWFADTLDHAAGIGARMPFWFQPDQARDAEIIRRFASLVDAARAGRLDNWNETPRGQLALIILLDQMPRNIYRGGAEAFASDADALAICMNGIGAGVDRKLEPAGCLFYYMPLQHAESLEAQENAS